jgi:membrane protease YdiL (CAAX protease family)
MPTPLEAIDWTLFGAGGIVLTAGVVLSVRKGWKDPLRGSPLRPNRLTPIVIWACFGAHLLGWGIGDALMTTVDRACFVAYLRGWGGGHPWAPLVMPPWLSPGIANTWRSIFVANFAQLSTAAVCLLVGAHFFRGGLRGLGLGRQSIPRDVAWAAGGLMVALFLCQITLMVTEALLHWLAPQFTPPEHAVFDLLDSGAAPWWMGAVATGGAILIAPVGEELFFRGIVQTGLSRLLPPRAGSLRHRWVAIVGTALLFAFMHIATPHHVPALAVLAVILGFVYERTGSIVAPILLHAMFNGRTILWRALGVS